MSLTWPSLTTRKPIGFTLTPVPAPPAKGSLGGCGAPYSPPPATKPNDTRDIGIIVAPAPVSTASPTTTLTSIMSLRFSIVVLIMLSIGLLPCWFSIP